MSVAVLASLLVVLWVVIVYGWVVGKLAGSRPYRSVSAPAVVMTAVLGMVQLMLLGLDAFVASFSLVQHLQSSRFLVHLVIFGALYTVARVSPTHQYVFLVLSLFDRVLDGTGIRRTYRRRMAGKAFDDILRAERLGRYR